MIGLCVSQNKYCEKSYVFEISASFHFNFGCDVYHCQLYTHCRKEDNIKRVPHCDMCLINLFNVLLYIKAGLRKCLCLFGQQGYFFAIPLTRYPATKHTGKLCFAICFVCKVHGNFNVPCNETYGNWYMEISMYLALCFIARYMEISMYLGICFIARYLEISMYLAICYIARYMEISTYLAVCFIARCIEISMYLAICFIARYMEISMYLEVCFVARHMEISMYLAKVNVSLQGTWKFPCTLPKVCM